MSKLDRVGIGFSHSARAYADKNGAPVTTMPLPQLAHHHFFATPDNQLGHSIDGKLRATVPPEGMEEYAKTWPDCADLASALLGKSIDVRSATPTTAGRRRR